MVVEDRRDASASGAEAVGMADLLPVVEIRFLDGDASAPEVAGNAIVVHLCNDAGRWGHGFARTLSQRWKPAEIAYRDWYARRAGNDFGLGVVQVVPVAPRRWVANLVVEHGRAPASLLPPLREDALEQALRTLAVHARARRASVHLSLSGVAAREWETIEPVIAATLGRAGIELFAYDAR